MLPGIVPQLISQRLWDDAHEKLDSRKRESKSGFNNIFAGLIKCDKCGHALGIANASGRNNYYVCNTYKKKGPSVCSSHYIMYNELYEAVLMDINSMLYMVREKREDFIERVLHKVSCGCDTEDARIENEIAELEAKIVELDRKFEKLYDDRFNGILSDRKFQELSTRCEAEQDEARERRAVLVKKRNSSQATEYGTEQFIAIAESYENLTELDDEVLNRLIQSIVVGDRIKENGETEQHICINYKFIGEIA
jgi:hypothetical protein